MFSSNRTRPAGHDLRLAEICQAAADGGDDPELDTLLLRLHTETACRRGGALALRPDDLDSGQCLIRLREKGNRPLAAGLAHLDDSTTPAPPGTDARQEPGRALGHFVPGLGRSATARPQVAEAGQPPAISRRRHRAASRATIARGSRVDPARRSPHPGT